jgi:putative membrane protein
MERVQSLIQGPSGGDEESATTKAADRVSEAVTNEPVPKVQKQRAGQLVHYAFGAGLGLLYGALATQWRGLTAGFGALFGLGVALVADEGLVPALRLGPPPTDVSPKTHLYSLASHLVFGASLEAGRRILGGPDASSEMSSTVS